MTPVRWRLAAIGLLLCCAAFASAAVHSEASLLGADVLLTDDSDDAAAPSVQLANCTLGVDLATPVSASAFDCLVQTHGVQFLTVRVFQSDCYVDPHTVDTIHAAWAAGLSGVDLYFFPSYGCSLDPISQFDSTLSHLASNAANFNRLYFDVEDWSWDPESSCADNVAWFMPLWMHAQQTLGVERVGIYSMKSMWDRITCGSTAFNSSLLWYARWDQKPTFEGFVPFGGWTAPDLKQYAGNQFACDIHLDFDYRESGEC